MKIKNNLTKDEKIKIKKKYLITKKRVFLITLFVIGFIGLLIPLRPKKSVLEKRELEKFPKFTLSSFWDGSYFSAISTWYADTFPFREQLLSANSSFKNLYGVQGEQIVMNTEQTADEIPTGSLVLPETSEAESQESEAETEVETEEETYEDGAIHDVPEMSGNVYVTGDTAFSVFYFDLNGSNAYIQMMNKAQKRLDGIADVYDILVPTSLGICLDEDAQKEIGASLQNDAMDYVVSSINSINNKVKTVNTFDTLKKHNSEYIYFRTDHHWTALGAYYAYQDFCKVKGIEAESINSFETMEFPGFVGSFYASSNQVASLKENPDTVTAYIPKDTNDMFFYDSSLQKINWKIINDVSEYSENSKYATFIAGDEIYAQIDNTVLDDESSCVVIKESFGDAFIPFLVDHYQHIYIVDYRYFYKYPEYNNSIYELVKDKNVQDVIFINNASAMTTEKSAALMSELFD